MAYDNSTDNDVSVCYNHNNIEKIVVILYRETVKKETQYYFLNNEISFVIDKLTEYPSTYQTKGSKTKTDKLYFANKKLIYFVNMQNAGWEMPPPEEVFELFKEDVKKIIKAK